jgi:hypothetical protein
MISLAMLSGLDAKSASCFLKNSHAMVGQVIGITWTFPRRIHAISVFISSIILCIHLVGELFASISGRLPTIGHGLGPGGTWKFVFVRILGSFSYGFDYYHKTKKYNMKKRPNGLRE